jgi:hypothetical protein
MMDESSSEEIQADALNTRLRDLLLNRATVGSASSDSPKGTIASISCSLCGKTFRISHDNVGRSGICPKCGRRIDFEGHSDQSTKQQEPNAAQNLFSPEPVIEDADDTPEDASVFTPVNDETQLDSQSWPTVVPMAVPAPFLGEEPLDLLTNEDEAEPLFEMDIEDSAATWLDIEDEHD